VRDRSRRLDPRESVLAERKLAQERRADPERMDRRADVVVEAGEGQLGGARSPAGGAGGLEHEH
jgi:hypothetical protein